MISFLSQACDLPSFSHIQLELKESWKRKGEKGDGGGWVVLKSEPVIAQRRGEVPALVQSRAFENLGLDVNKERRKGSQRGTLAYLATSMNFIPGGLVCKRLGGEASLALEAVGLSSGSPWERMVDGVFIFTNENLHLYSWAGSP